MILSQDGFFMRCPSPKTKVLGNYILHSLKSLCCGLLTILEAKQEANCQRGICNCKDTDGLLFSFVIYPDRWLLSTRHGSGHGSAWVHNAMNSKVFPVGWGLAREPRAVCILDKSSATELHTSSPNTLCK